MNPDLSLDVVAAPRLDEEDLPSFSDRSSLACRFRKNSRILDKLTFPYPLDLLLRFALGWTIADGKGEGDNIRLAGEVPHIPYRAEGKSITNHTHRICITIRRFSRLQGAGRPTSDKAVNEDRPELNTEYDACLIDRITGKVRQVAFNSSPMQEDVDSRPLLPDSARSDAVFYTFTYAFSAHPTTL